MSGSRITLVTILVMLDEGVTVVIIISSSVFHLHRDQPNIFGSNRIRIKDEADSLMKPKNPTAPVT